jgi:hypothetical protein
MELNTDNEIQISEESEAEIILTVEESSRSIERSTTKIKEKHTNPSLKSKRHCTFKRKWLKDPKYSAFLRECRTNPHIAHMGGTSSSF